MSFTSNIDAAAEREGLAIEAMADYLDIPVPQSHLQIALGHARAAAAIGLPTRPKVPGYRWTESCKVHRWIQKRAPWGYFVWGPPASKRIPEGDAERIRQAEKRVRRLSLLLQLKFLPSRESLSLPMASTLSGIGLRTLERAVSTGRLESYRVGGQRRVRAGDLRKLLDTKLHGQPIVCQGRKSIAA